MLAQMKGGKGKASDDSPLSYFVLRSVAKAAAVTDIGNVTSKLTNFQSLNEKSNFTDLVKKKVDEHASALFKNIEIVRLTDEERVFLNAAAVGDVGLIRQSLEDLDHGDATFNVNCVDFMGRNALHLAVDSENVDVIDLLLDKLSFECIEEALLHAISKRNAKIVKIIIEHPNYMAHEDKIKRMDYNDAFFRNEEKSQFSPDITPLVLAAHYNNHEIIQMFLSRSHTIEKPHSIACECNSCQVKQNYDSLKRSRSRLNAYRALASPAYMALSSPDPIMTTFELRQEMMRLSDVEKEFKNEYLSLVNQCMVFACEMMDLCRGTQEVEAVLSEGSNEDETRDPLKRLRMALHYEEKKFVAHANLQQHLTTIWFGSDMAFLQSFKPLQSFAFNIAFVAMMPVLYPVTILFPQSKIGRCVRCPTLRFAGGTISHLAFLVLLLVATLRLSASHPVISSERLFNLPQFSHFTYEEKLKGLLRETLRPANPMLDTVHILIILWIVGMLLSEIKQTAYLGINEYITDMYNVLDYVILSLYSASYTLRVIVYFWIRDADFYFNATAQAQDALTGNNFSEFSALISSVKRFRDDRQDPRWFRSYLMEADRFSWSADDPEIASDVLFAIANVLTFAKATYMMPAFEMLGPLQISFARMLGDIIRFLVLFLLVLFAFMVGLHNLYWYYGSHEVWFGDPPRWRPASETFEGLIHTLYSLFWCMFGQTNLQNLPVRHPNANTTRYIDGMPDSTTSTLLVESVGLALFAIYHVIIIIVLVNMLIAMMSHSFESIQEDTDVEWKFARTRLWLSYMDNDDLPVPFNLVPSPHFFRTIYFIIKRHCCTYDYEFRHQVPTTYTFIQERREQACRDMRMSLDNTSYIDIMQRLVRRYLFKMERAQKASEEKMSKDTGIMGAQMIAVEDVAEPYGPAPVIHGESDSDTSSVDHLKHRAIKTKFSDMDGDDRWEYGRYSRAYRRSNAYNRRSNMPASLATAPGVNPPAITNQVLTIPQLDAIQRTQKILDMRLQHLQQEMDSINTASGAPQIKADLETVRDLISDQQKTSSSIIKFLGQVQGEIIKLNENMHKWVESHAKQKQLRTIIIEEAPTSSDMAMTSSTTMQRDSESLSPSIEVTGTHRESRASSMRPSVRYN